MTSDTTAPPPPTMICDIRRSLAISSTGDAHALTRVLIGVAVGTWRRPPSFGKVSAVEPDGPRILPFPREPWGGLEDIALCMERASTGYRPTSLDGYCKLGRASWNRVVAHFVDTVVAPAMRLSSDFPRKSGAYGRAWMTGSPQPPRGISAALWPQA